MAKPSDSFKQFDYALRPSKQVERKIMMEVLLKLAKAGFSINEYRYIGFGSVYYVDFVMFHKYLFIEDMVCVEWSDIERRMRFNKPYKFIKLKLMPLSSFIPNIRNAEKSLVWLDYDRPLDNELLLDIEGVSTRVGPQSIVIITVDARPRLPRELFDTDSMSIEEREELTLSVYQKWFSQYVSGPIARDTVASVHVAPLFYEVMLERVRQTVTRRSSDLRFIQLFNYVYRDGAPMLTIGGMIGNREDEAALRKAGIMKHRFVRTGTEALVISVPPLTLREKQWLDCHLDDHTTLKKVRFELDKDLLHNYRSFYKEYPVFLETLL